MISLFSYLEINHYPINCKAFAVAIKPQGQYRWNTQWNTNCRDHRDQLQKFWSDRASDWRGRRHPEGGHGSLFVMLHPYSWHESDSDSHPVPLAILSIHDWKSHIYGEEKYCVIRGITSLNEIHSWLSLGGLASSAKPFHSLKNCQTQYGLLTVRFHSQNTMKSSSGQIFHQN